MRKPILRCRAAVQQPWVGRIRGGRVIGSEADLKMQLSSLVTHSHHHSQSFAFFPTFFIRMATCHGAFAASGGGGGRACNEPQPAAVPMRQQLRGNNVARAAEQTLQVRWACAQHPSSSAADTVAAQPYPSFPFEPLSSFPLQQACSLRARSSPAGVCSYLLRTRPCRHPPLLSVHHFPSFYI